MADIELVHSASANVSRHAWQESGHWLDRAKRLARLRTGGHFAPQGLAATIKPLREGSVACGVDLLQGNFILAGETVTAAPGRIFIARSASPAWRDALIRLEWLPNLQATDQHLARLMARNLVKAWQAEVLPHIANPHAARALINLSHAAPFLFQQAPAEFSADFARIIAELVRRMASRWIVSKPALLETSVALATATTAFRINPAIRDLAYMRLSKALEQSVYPDGGHISRNACKLVDLALDLLPLRTALHAARSAVPPPLNAALERILPMLRLLALGDGGLAGLQGARPRTAELAALRAADQSQGRPLTFAPHAGFARLAFQQAVLVADVGKPQSCEGALAFEFSHGAQRIITGCGSAGETQANWCSALRRSAAHSTWDMGDASPGPDPRVTAEVLSSPQGALLKSRHDTARLHQQCSHQRNLFLSSSGLDCRGEEKVTAPHSTATETLRFHLHPDVCVEPAPHPNCVALSLPSGETWSFSQAGGTMSIAESIYMGEDNTPRASSQILIQGVQANGLHVQWALRRKSAAAA